jgi:glucan phosphoethanolaminetransferase (alkaline phosphatase superfamily)
MDQKPTRISINYLYFGAFLILLGLMSTSSVLIKEYFIGSRFFFLLYAFGQIILEVGGLIFLAFLIQRYGKPIYYWMFIGCTFFLAMLHILDFLMDRILDLSAWDTARIVLDENLHDFIYLLDASGIALWAWILLFSSVLALPFLGIGLYKITNFLAKKKPLSLRIEFFFQAFVCIPVALFLWDASASRVIHPDAYSAFVKSLPWKFTFIQPKNVLITPSGSIIKPMSEQIIKKEIDQVSSKIAKRPNIYLFVIESLRDDFITKETAPHLSQFRNESIFYNTSVSNANGTHPSWFSIFHSQFGIFWNQYRKNNWSSGSPALQLLKKWGYQIRIYTSAQLGYYGMDELIFGEGLHLADSLSPFYHGSSTEVWQSDKKTIESAKKDLKEHPELKEGQLFIFFWDSTHFDYSWPKHEENPFVPFASNIAYFRTYQTQKNIEQIKNSYRNSIHYIDSLFGSFWQDLPEKSEAIVAVIGDHGEEFFEHGHLFHNSHLIDEQTRVPLYFRFGSKNKPAHPKTIVSQMDFFPSLLDHLSGQTFSFLQGESIFRKSTWPYAMICRFNGGHTPYEFSFHNGRNKVISQFSNRNDIFSPQSLKIKSLWNCQNQDVSECKLNVESWIEQEFQEAFDRIFHSN